MQVKRYEVSSVQEAMAQIKGDLGPDAVILSTKTIAGTRPPRIEVLAAMDEPLDRRPARRETKRAGNGPGPVIEEGLQGLRREVGEIRQLITEGTGGRRLLRDLSEIRENVSVLLDALGPVKVAGGSDLLTKLSDRLVREGFSKGKASAIVAAVRRHPDLFKAKTVRDVDRVARTVLAEMLSDTTTRPLPKRVRAFVGPTGVGKTTTLAKLAAAATVAKKGRTGVITLDTYRIAAAEQLKIYAGIMGIPCEIASDRTAFGRALEKMSDCDAILVDTPGRAPRDAQYLEVLRDILAAEDNLSVSLLLSPATQRDCLQEAVERYAVLDYDTIILTKTDECRSCGALCDLLDGPGRVVSHWTTGQDVPQDIEEATPEKLAGLMMGSILH